MRCVNLYISHSPYSIIQPTRVFAPVQRTSETTLKSMERIFFGLLPNIFKWNTNIEKSSDYKAAFPADVVAVGDSNMVTGSHGIACPTERAQRAHRRASLTHADVPPSDPLEVTSPYSHCPLISLYPIPDYDPNAT